MPTARGLTQVDHVPSTPVSIARAAQTRQRTLPSVASQDTCGATVRAQ
jgi:hypothetical protein